MLLLQLSSLIVELSSSINDCLTFVVKFILRLTLILKLIEQILNCWFNLFKCFAAEL